MSAAICLWHVLATYKTNPLAAKPLIVRVRPHGCLKKTPRQTKKKSLYLITF